MLIARADGPGRRGGDGATAHELLQPVCSGLPMSLVESILAPGDRATAHRHWYTDEMYYILAGKGTVTIGSKTKPVRVGDAIAVPRGSIHFLSNEGNDAPLRFLAVCHPGFSEDDTYLIEDH